MGTGSWFVWVTEICRPLRLSMVGPGKMPSYADQPAYRMPFSHSLSVCVRSLQ